MITQAILSFFGTIIGFGLDLIPDALGVPTWMEDGLNATLGIFRAGASLAVWIPVPMVIAGAGFRVAVIMGAFSVKFLRMLVSLFTGGGGSAA